MNVFERQIRVSMARGGSGPGVVRSNDPDRVQRTIHVGGLPFEEISEETLAEYFAHVGEVRALCGVRRPCQCRTRAPAPQTGRGARAGARGAQERPLRLDRVCVAAVGAAGAGAGRRVHGHRHHEGVGVQDAHPHGRLACAGTGLPLTPGPACAR